MMRKRSTWVLLGTLIVGTLAFVAGAASPSPPQFFNCKIVSCPAPACEYGEHLETPPGQCCPVCVAD